MSGRWTTIMLSRSTAAMSPTLLPLILRRRPEPPALQVDVDVETGM